MNELMFNDTPVRKYWRERETETRKRENWKEKNNWRERERENYKECKRTRD